MFRASRAHLQEDTVVYMQHILLSLCKQVSGQVLLDHSPVYRVTVPYDACVQLYPPEDEHLRLETCRRKYFMNK